MRIPAADGGKSWGMRRALIVLLCLCAACSSVAPPQGQSTGQPETVARTPTIAPSPVRPSPTPLDEILTRPLTTLAPAVSATLAAAIGPQPDETNELFVDDFAAFSGNWETYKSARGSVAYQAGELVIGVPAARTRAITFPRGVAFGDTVLYVSARRVSGPPDAGFGLICRYLDDDNYYFFLVTADNYAIIGKRTGGKLIGLSSPELAALPEPLLPNDAPNLLRATCVGRELSLWLNSHQVTSATDPELPSGGNVGLLATAFDLPGALVAFDDFSVFAP